MREVKTIVYVSDDGTTFNTKEECIKYESNDNFSIESALNKIKFYDKENRQLMYSFGELMSVYLEDNPEVNFDSVFIIKISPDITKKELEIIKKFFDSYDNKCGYYVPDNIYIGAVYQWNDCQEEWEDIKDILERLKKEYNRIECLKQF